MNPLLPAITATVLGVAPTAAATSGVVTPGAATTAAAPTSAATPTPAAEPNSVAAPEADTIYLANGRVIHTDSVTVEDGRVHFTQFGGAVSIPLDEVVRIVDNDKVERATETSPAGKNAAAEKAVGMFPQTSTDMAGNARVLEDAVASSPVGNAASPDEPEYWIERILQVDERIARVQAELDRLPHYDEIDTRLLRFSGQALYFIAERERWETLMGQLKLTRRRLLHGARKAGITPGSLRRGLGK